jgi:hypothetical protein
LKRPKCPEQDYSTTALNQFGEFGMALPIHKTPVEDTVPKVNNDIAVGEDVEFQRKWWKFEKVVWAVFIILVLLDLAGAFGRGPLSEAHLVTADGAVNVSYERIERTGTPSTLRVRFKDSAIHNNQIHLWASENLVSKLGNKQIAPQPATSTVGDGGLLYTFPATSQPAEVVFSLQPAAPGLYDLSLGIDSSSDLHFKILVMP